MTATVDLDLDLDPGLGRRPGPGFDEGVDFGLSDTDVGAGLVTLAASLGHEVRSLGEAALVETVGVLESCVRWVPAEVGVRVAELARRRGGPTDIAAAAAVVGADGAGARLGLSEWDARRPRCARG